MKIAGTKTYGLVMILWLMCFGTSVFGQTQAALNAQANAKYQKADKELNTVYQKILKSYASQPVFIKKLKVAQRLWVQLRDAELAAKYPAPGTYGSVEPMCKAMYLEKLTQERTRFLRAWLNGVQEGDTCNGSIKAK